MSKRARAHRIRVLAILLIIVVASVVGIYSYRALRGGVPFGVAPSCSDPLGGASVLRTQLPPPMVIGGITEFTLPSPLREATSPYVAPDGSLWFAEQSVAGLAHFYPGNRTLVEYEWPYAYPAPPAPSGICGQKTSTWSVVSWDGKIWASDSSGNQLVGMDPATGQLTTIQIPTANAFPYTLTVGPNDTLWFTELFTGKIGFATASGTVQEFPVPGGDAAEPAQIVFANATTGYYCAVGLNVPGGGGVYSFDVENFAPKLVGGQHLEDPTSLSLGDGAIWVALHGSSSVASYNLTTGGWAYYPTTPITWVSTTLPYFVQANGATVWLNEHYGNRMAQIDPANDSLVEYNESNQPVNGTSLGNTLTFALGGGRAWFAAETGNIIGYVDYSYSPGFYTAISGNTTVTVPRGSSATVDLVVHDTTHQGGLTLSFADSEGFSSTPQNLTFSVPSASVSPPPGGQAAVTVTVAALTSLKPGTYYALLTATDGSTYESSILKVVVPE